MIKRNIFPLLVFFFLFCTGTSFFAQSQPNLARLPGPKKTIAVARFENTSGINSYIALGDDFSAQLSDALIQSGMFIVLSRKDLGTVLSEQDLAESGRMAKSLAASKGKVIPAQILITGNITEFEESTQGGNQGLSIHGISIGMGKSDAHIAVIVQIIDSTTGEILDSQRVEGLADASGFSVGYSGSFSVGSSSFKKTPLGKATQIAIDRAVEYISQRLAMIPWQGRVVTIKDGLVYINAGSDTGIINGETFIVCRKGDALIDPETGVELGAEKTKIGDIVISEVQPKFSKAKILSNTDQIRPSDLVIKQ
jgi:curli biogenesis system outer membrane secretion channel CsgG